MADSTSSDNSTREIKELLERHSSLEIVKETNRVKCHFTGHEMLCRADVIQSYITGKKYRQASAEELVNKLKPHIIHSRFHSNKLFCKLTRKTINRELHHIERHVNGRRYKKALERWNFCEENGIKFKPIYGTQKEEKVDEKDDSSDNGVVVKEDNMEDLYPDDELASSDDNDHENDDDNNTDDTDFEFEDLEPMPNKKNTLNGQKRPLIQLKDVPNKQVKLREKKRKT